jgi:hypothetical protein
VVVLTIALGVTSTPARRVSGAADSRRRPHHPHESLRHHVSSLVGLHVSRRRRPDRVARLSSSSRPDM